MVYSKSLAAILFSFALLSCGPASEYVDVTLITPIGMNHSFHSLQENFNKTNFLNEMMLSAPSGYCHQNNILIGTNEYVGSNQIVTKKFDIFSETVSLYPCAGTSAGTTSEYITCLQNAYIETQPIVRVIKGKLVDIGIIGTFYPATADSNNDCSTGEGGPLPIYANASIIGHKQVNLSQATTINLDIWVNKVKTTPTNDLAKKEFLQITDQDSSLKILGVRYFKSSKGDPGVYQNLKETGAGVYYVPRFYPMAVYYNNAGTDSYQLITGPQTITGGTGGTRTINFADSF